MKKVIIIVISLILCFGCYFLYYVYSNSDYVIVNNKKYTNLETLDTDILHDLTCNLEQSFIEPELNKYITHELVMYNEDTEINSTDFIVNKSNYTRGISNLRKKNYTANYKTKIDYNGIENWLKNYNKTATISKDAYITKGDKEYEIVAEVYGTKVKTKEIIDDLKSGRTNIKLEDYYKKPKVISDMLVHDLNYVNSFVNWRCLYTNGCEIKSSLDYVDYVNGNVYINSDWLDKEILKITLMYDTEGKVSKKFRTHDNNKITVSGGTWGSLTDTESEIKVIKKAFHDGVSIENHEPIYFYKRDKIGKTYIEVSIQEQHLWVYKDKELVMESDVVTGNDTGYNGERRTPTGIYYISECVPGKYLIGPGYKTWVNKWMRLTNMGVGLHDAGWRGSFGGQIYKNDGSHGCINLPADFANKLFEFAYVGLPVIIY